MGKYFNQQTTTFMGNIHKISVEVLKDSGRLFLQRSHHLND